MFLDFIEIGTSDFDTEIQKNPTKRGISIEPVRYYLDRLPESPTCKKLNMGISNYNGVGTVNYLSEEIIKKNSFPSWVRGCNSINSYHASVSKLCKARQLNIEDIASSYDIPICTPNRVLTEQNVSGIYYLKVDTEGHDTVILKHFFASLTPLTMPHVILFESNCLTKTDDIDEVISLYKGIGYDMIYRNNNDTLLQLNLTRLTKTQFTEELDKYYIMDYPPEYNPQNLPHENTLEAAQDFCRKNKYSGVTFQDGLYEVRAGKYMKYCSTVPCRSWALV
jgi:hypothetical protein